MTSNVKACTPSDIYTVNMRMAWTGQNIQKLCLICQKDGFKTLGQSRVKYF